MNDYGITVNVWWQMQEQSRKHVGFSGGAQMKETAEAARPSRLHRRDTPHHLKNKRIVPSIDKDKVASIIAQVILKSLNFLFCSFCSVVL